MNIPIIKACNIDPPVGIGSLGTPSSLVRREEFIPYNWIYSNIILTLKTGRAIAKAAIIAGKTNIIPCIKIICMMPT